MNAPTSKHNLIADELGQVRDIEKAIAETETDVLNKRLAQGRLLASLKNNIQGVEPWESWVPANLGFTRKTADNYINLARWYNAHFEEGRADKEAHLAMVAESGGKSEYRHDGYTSFNAVYELLSKRAKKVALSMKPAAAKQTTKPRKLTAAETLAALQKHLTRLVQALTTVDPGNPALHQLHELDDTELAFDLPEIPASAPVETAPVETAPVASAPVPDAVVPDAVVPDAVMPDVAMPDTAVPDAPTPDVPMLDVAPLATPEAAPLPAAPWAAMMEGEAEPPPALEPLPPLILEPAQVVPKAASKSSKKQPREEPPAESLELAADWLAAH